MVQVMAHIKRVVIGISEDRNLIKVMPVEMEKSEQKVEIIKLGS